MQPRYITRGQGAGKISSLQRGSFTYIEVFFHIALNFTIIGVKKIIVRSTGDFVIEVPP